MTVVSFGCRAQGEASARCVSSKKWQGKNGPSWRWENTPPIYFGRRSVKGGASARSVQCKRQAKPQREAFMPSGRRSLSAKRFCRAPGEASARSVSVERKAEPQLEAFNASARRSLSAKRFCRAVGEASARSVSVER